LEEKKRREGGGKEEKRKEREGELSKPTPSEADLDAATALLLPHRHQ